MLQTIEQKVLHGKGVQISSTILPTPKYGGWNSGVCHRNIWYSAMLCLPGYAPPFLHKYVKTYQERRSTNIFGLVVVVSGEQERVHQGVSASGCLPWQLQNTKKNCAYAGARKFIVGGCSASEAAGDRACLHKEVEGAEKDRLLTGSTRSSGSERQLLGDSEIVSFCLH